MLLWELFQTFLVIGFVSFGGGYAMIPVIGHQVEAHQWMTVSEYADIIAVAGMSPGPTATNSAIFVGYRVDGLAGAVAAAAGMTLPSLLIILVVAAFFYKMHRNRYVKAAFYGLRPVVAGLILYGAVRFAASIGMLTGSLTWQAGAPFLFFAASLIALTKFKMHPFYVIVLSGLAGAAIYG